MHKKKINVDEKNVASLSEKRKKKQRLEDRNKTITIK